MEKSYKAKLWVNGPQIELNPFVEAFLAHVSIGAVKSLKGVIDYSNIEIDQKQQDVEIKVDGTPVPLILFPMKIISGTLVGLASTLKGVDRIDTLRVTIDIN